MNRQSSNEELQMAKRYFSIRLNDLREMQIQTSLNFHITSVRMAIIKKTSKCWQGCEEKGTITHCWYEGKLVQSPWKSACSFLKKLTVGLLCDLAVWLVGIYTKDCKHATEISTYPCFLLHYSQQVRYGISVNSYQQRNGWRKCGADIQWSFTWL